MSDVSSFDFPAAPISSAAEPEEDFSMGLLIEGGDQVDASVEAVDEVPTPRAHSDSCDVLPPLFLSSSSTTGGDVLKCGSPFIPMKTGADVISLFNPKKRASGDVEEEVFSNKVQFKYSQRKASAAVQHFMFGKDVHPTNYADIVDAQKGHRDVADSPTGNSSGPGHSRVQIHRCQSIEDEFRYRMNFGERGCFVIFNQETFDMYNKLHPDEEPLKYRAGSDKDAFNLESAAKHLGFNHVRIIHNSTRIEIIQWIYTLSKADHLGYDCFACAILTHGGNGDILYARDEKMKLTDFTRPFGADLCPTLAGKPKLFFIQACRGVKLDRGQRILRRTRPSDAVDGPTPLTDGPSGKGTDKVVTIPTEADFLIANSTVSDYYAWRNETNGSWFVQSLCAVFVRYGHRMELMQMMTRVNKMVAYQFESSSSDEGYDQKKQIPSIATRLTHEVYFTPKQYPTQQAHPPVPQAYCSTPPPPPATSSTMVCQTSSEARYGNIDVMKKETFVATTVTAPQVVYPSGDYNVSPGLVKADMFFPSPKNVTKPAENATKVPRSSPMRACPRLQFPETPENYPLSNSTPKPPTARKLSDVEAYSQSLGTSGLHGSATVSGAMNQMRNPNSPRRNPHRCSVPTEDVLRKAIKQTNV